MEGDSGPLLVGKDHRKVSCRTGETRNKPNELKYKKFTYVRWFIHIDPCTVNIDPRVSIIENFEFIIPES
jgi:hypothetical protein